MLPNSYTNTKSHLYLTPVPILLFFIILVYQSKFFIILLHIHVCSESHIDYISIAAYISLQWCLMLVVYLILVLLLRPVVPIKLNHHVIYMIERPEVVDFPGFCIDMLQMSLDFEFHILNLESDVGNYIREVANAMIISIVFSRPQTTDFFRPGHPDLEAFPAVNESSVQYVVRAV